MVSVSYLKLQILYKISIYDLLSGILQYEGHEVVGFGRFYYKWNEVWGRTALLHRICFKCCSRSV